MHAVRAISLKRSLLAAGAALAMIVLVPVASADPIPVTINFVGAGFSGHATLTLGTDPLASASYPIPQLPPYPGGPGSPLPAGAISTLPSSIRTSRVDPQYAQRITGASGTVTIGSTNLAITGVMDPAAAQTAPSKGEYVPGSLTRISTTSTDFPTVTYDDVFYPGGSPLTCLWYFGTDGTGALITHAKYPFSGGALDPYGVMLELGGGSMFLDLWSNGNGIPGPPPPFGNGGPAPLNYGAVLLSKDATSGAFSVEGVQFDSVRASLPAPSGLWLLGAGLLGLFGWRRWRESRRLADVD